MEKRPLVLSFLGVAHSALKLRERLSGDQSPNPWHPIGEFLGRICHGNCTELFNVT